MSMSRYVAVIVSLILLAGCASLKSQVNTVTCETVIVKCNIPEIPPAELEAVPQDAPYDTKLQIILNNCLKIQQENELLKKALEICR
jgi:PBP1b-binding outer membrane lipoprotein LpoB